MSEYCKGEQTYELVRSKRKTMTLSVSKELNVVVKAPLKMPIRDIEAFVYKHSDWVQKQLTKMQQRQSEVLSEGRIESLKSQAKSVLPPIVARYSAIMGVEPQGIKITSATTRWGSCSSKNNLCFPYRIMLLPPELMEYVVVHELAHIRVKDHSSKFYDEVAKYMPDYKQRIAKLKKIF